MTWKTVAGVCRRFIRQTDGVDLIEYALLATFVVVTAQAGVTMLGDSLGGLYTGVFDSIAEQTAAAGVTSGDGGGGGTTGGGTSGGGTTGGGTSGGGTSGGGNGNGNGNGGGGNGGGNGNGGGGNGGENGNGGGNGNGNGK